MSDREFLTEPCKGSGEPPGRSYLYTPIGESGLEATRYVTDPRSSHFLPLGGESDSADEATVKCTSWTDGNCPPRADSSDTASTTSSSDDDSGGRDYVPQEEPNYRTLTPNRCADTRCNDDFKWMPTTEIVDDITDKHSEARDEYPTNSLDRRRKTSDRSDRDRKTRSSMSSKPPTHPSSVRASPRPRRSRVEDSPDLQRRWNSYEHFRWPPEGGWWPPMCWCHGPPPPPPCCMHDRGWPSHPSLPPASVHSHKNDAEDRVRRLEADKESLQLQVQVLSEQISAQGEKMNDLERALHDARQRLDDAEQRLQKEMLQRSSLETQKLELLSKLSEMRLRVAERGVMERSPPPETSTPITRPAPPRTPPANYGRVIERNTLMYSSLPRSALMTSLAGKHTQVAGKGHSVPNLAEREENSRGSPSPLGRGETRLEGSLVRGPLRHTTPTSRLRDHIHLPQWQSIDIRQWDAETTCSWLESLNLEMYIPAMKSWLNSTPDARGIIATATPQTIEKELSIKHPMHKKKIVLAVTDLLGNDPDPYLRSAGGLDTVWVVRWLDDVGVAGARGAATDVGLDGRGLHRLTHLELYTHLHVTQAIHAHSVRRGIQVLRDNNFNPDTMVRRAAEGSDSTSEDIARWSTHRVMQWLNEIDLAEYAPNLRGAGVHGGLMLLEPRFTAELLAALLNIPANKTLLRRHLTQRFNDLLGRDVIQQKRNAETTLGYQPLTATTKYKVPKKSQFSLKRKKSKDESDYSDLVCPLNDDGSGDVYSLTTTRVEAVSDVVSDVCRPRDVTHTPPSPFEPITTH